MSKTLIEQFEPALIHRMLRLGANVDRFADGDEFGGFRFLHGGTPSEWRTNLHLGARFDLRGNSPDRLAPGNKKTAV